MNVYDFDKTIYRGDSTIDFYFFCLKKKPQILLCAWKQFFAIFLRKINKISTTQMKEAFFCFLARLDDPEEMVQHFWISKQTGIKQWYLEQKQANDVIISASPFFLLEPVCKNLDISNLIATDMDLKTGQICGENCKGEEKVRRFYEVFPNGHIEQFYSDSLSDTPLAVISDEAYLVNGDTRQKWAR